MVVIDGKNLILGRAASVIAKKLLNGEEVHLINSEEMVITGNPKAIVERYQTRRRLQHKGQPEKSPKWPKTPYMLVKRIIRGMLPYKKARGREAYKKLRVYSKNEKNLTPDTEIKNAAFSGFGKHIRIKELCKLLGYNG